MNKVEDKDLVTCLECGAKMKWIQNTHLIKHGMTTKEYREKYPDAKLKSDTMTKRLIDTRRKTEVTKVCEREGCNNLCSTNRNKYCSYSCSSIVSSTSPDVYNPFRDPKTNPSFKDGATEHWIKQRKVRAELDNHTCQCCGKDKLDGKRRKYGVHHIVPRKFFKVPEELEERDGVNNTITLCNKCHKIIEELTTTWVMELYFEKNFLSRDELISRLREKIVNYEKEKDC